MLSLRKQSCRNHQHFGEPWATQQPLEREAEMEAPSPGAVPEMEVDSGDGCRREGPSGRRRREAENLEKKPRKKPRKDQEP